MHMVEDRELWVTRGLPFIEKLTEIYDGDSAINKEEILSLIFNETLILITDVSGIITYVNSKCCDALGYQEDELLGQHTRIFKTGLHTGEYYKRLWCVLKKGKVWKDEMSAKRKDGSVCWNFMSIFPLFDDSNQIYGFLTLRTDITDQKHLKQHTLLQEKISEIQSNEVFGCVDENNTCISINPAVKNILGYDSSEIIGANAYDLVKEEDIPHFQAWFEELKKHPGHIDMVEVRVSSKRGSWVDCELTAKNLLHDPEIRGIVFINRNITEQKDLFNRIEKVEYFDLVTGLPNGKFFMEHLSKEIKFSKENNKVFAVILVGLDDFKYINTTLGFQVGNQLLSDFSIRINESLEHIDAIIFRPSGDKYYIVIKDIDDFEEIPRTLTGIYDHINSKPFETKGEQIYLTASMGISVFPFTGETLDLLVKNVETAFYNAKNKGKNQYQIFSPTMNLNSYKQFTLKNDSKKALLNDEYCIYYQPRYNPITDEMVAAEALIRWDHPKWGIVSPKEFIHMAEKSGLIVQMGEWLIDKVCSHIKLWENEGLSVNKISINLSALQLLQPNFADMVSVILKNSEVDSRRIEFEITESVLIQKEQQVLSTLYKLRDMGISIALDDFGTEYCSLNYLRKFPCETIKFDKSLIDEIHKDPDSYEIMASNIKLCHKLKKSVVAEGVETAEQLSLLKDLKCDEIQGYLYSKPLDEHNFKELLKGQNWEKKVNNDHIVKMNRRKYFRVQFKVPLLADMTIEEIEQKRLNLGSSQVYIKDIGPEGLCFCSTLSLPVKKDIILQFKTEILFKEVTFKGYIVWSEEIDNIYHRYGVKFIVQEKEKELLIKFLNHLQVKLKKDPFLPGCRLENI
jgi:diguanylate cyclase (GGDEF)-like protein/PAS domain S-box-containing protein